MCSRKIQVDSSQIKSAIKLWPSAKEALEHLFPEVFSNNTPFASFGVLLKRKGYPNNFYALQKHEGQAKLLNITHSCYWEKGVDLTTMYDSSNNFVTVSEFDKISKGQSSAFSIAF